jgi:hypothetical protein
LIWVKVRGAALAQHGAPNPEPSMPESSIPYIAVILAMFAAFAVGFGYISIRELIDGAREARAAAKTPAKTDTHMDQRRAA